MIDKRPRPFATMIMPMLDGLKTCMDHIVDKITVNNSNRTNDNGREKRKKNATVHLREHMCLHPR